MNVKKVMQALQAFHPRLFMGSERFKVCTAVADYQSVYEPEGIYVLNSLETKGCHCAPTIVTCNEFLGCLPPTAINVILVEIFDLEEVAGQIEKMF